MREEGEVSRTVPTTIAGRRIPARFRNPLLRLDDPVAVLCEFLRWLEESELSPRPHERPHTPDYGERELRRLRSDREALISTLVDLTDLIDSAALRAKARRALAAAGVESLDATGKQFDASQHRAVNRIPAPDHDHHAQVAETERLGYSDRGELIRPPEVLVYWHDPSGDGGMRQTP
jgi:hypothetical protein